MDKQKKKDIVIYAISILFIAWLLVSFIDVNLHNETTENYLKCNAFVLLLKLKGVFR